MDTFYRGLSAPQRSFSLGRPDLADSERPGAILAGLVNEALMAGSFEARRQERPAPAAPASSGWTPAYVERRDFGAFEDDDAPEAGPLGH